jgi:hypothetical protein
MLPQCSLDEQAMESKIDMLHLAGVEERIKAHTDAPIHHLVDKINLCFDNIDANQKDIVQVHLKTHCSIGTP